jgi:hypothetical protein
MGKLAWTLLSSALGAVLAQPGALLAEVGGGGSATTDCWVTFSSIPDANSPASTPKQIKCADQDTTCGVDPTNANAPIGDQDARVGYCKFQLRLNMNSTGVAGCSPAALPAGGFLIPYSAGPQNANPDNDRNPKNIPDFEPFQTEIDNNILPLTAMETNQHTGFHPVTVPMKIAFTANGPVFKTTTIKMHPSMCSVQLLKVSANKYTCPTGGTNEDVDTFNLTCTPEISLTTGKPISACTSVNGTSIASTFQQIQEHIFDRKCSTQAMCHQSSSDGFSHDLCLDSSCGGAYAGLCGSGPNCVPPPNTPVSVDAASDGLKRVDPGNPANSLLVHKINGGALLDSPNFGPGAYGFRMPYNSPPEGFTRPKLSANEIQLITDWITAGAPQNGFVPTTAKGACH